MVKAEECTFCNIVKGLLKVDIVYQDDKVTCFLDRDPINVGHVLIVPNTHVLDVEELSDDLAIHIMRVSQQLVKDLKGKYDLDGYTIMQNGGDFNDIGHYHMHVFPRYKGDGFGWTYGSEDEIRNDKIENNK